MKEMAAVEVGEARTRVRIRAFAQGADLVVIVDGEGAHVGAATLVAPGAPLVQPGKIPGAGADGPRARKPSWRDTVVAPPHREAEITREVASAVARATGKRTLCAAGIHVDDITRDEIRRIRANVRVAIRALVAELGTRR